MKKIIAIISGCLVAVLLAVTITLACVKFTAVGVVNEGAISIRLYKGKTTETVEIFDDRDEYDRIMEFYKDSLQENTLASLFQGATGFDYSVKHEEVTLSNITGNTEGTYVLAFVYNEAKTLTINGEKYVNENANTEKGESTDVTYRELYVEVKNTANFTEYKVYVVGTANASKSNFTVSLIAHQSELYSFLGEIEELY